MLFFLYMAALTDDERAIAERIFEQYHKLIFEIAYKILNDIQDAEDTISVVMINIMKNIEKFSGADQHDIEAQIVIYSRNAAINLYNKNKRRKKTFQSFTYVNDEGDLEEIDMPDESVCIDDTVLSDETAMIVKKYLEQLPEDYQQIIELVYGMGYTNVEVAHVLNTTPNAVTLKLFRAKKRLLEIAGGELSERLH